MTRTTALALLVLTGMVSTTGTVNADITYKVEEPFSGGVGFGTITTDGHLGTLNASDILNWSIAIENVEISGNGASIATGVSATTSELELDLTNTSSELKLSQDANHYADWTAGAITTGPEPYHLNFVGMADSQAMSNFSTNQEDSVGQIGVSAVPEPSTAIVAVFGAVAVIAYGWSRHRRAQRLMAAA